MSHMQPVPSIMCQCAKLDQYTDEIIVADDRVIVKVFGILGCWKTWLSGLSLDLNQMTRRGRNTV